MNIGRPRPEPLDSLPLAAPAAAAATQGAAKLQHFFAALRTEVAAPDGAAHSTHSRGWALSMMPARLRRRMHTLYCAATGCTSDSHRTACQYLWACSAVLNRLPTADQPGCSVGRQHCLALWPAAGSTCSRPPAPAAAACLLWAVRSSRLSKSNARRQGDLQDSHGFGSPVLFTYYMARDPVCRAQTGRIIWQAPRLAVGLNAWDGQQSMQPPHTLHPRPCIVPHCLSSSSRNQQSQQGSSSAPWALQASPKTKSSLVQPLSWAWATGCTRAGKARRPGKGPLRARPAFQGSGSCWGGARPGAATASAAAAARGRFLPHRDWPSNPGLELVVCCPSSLQPSQEPWRCGQGAPQAATTAGLVGPRSTAHRCGIAGCSWVQQLECASAS